MFSWRQQQQQQQDASLRAVEGVERMKENDACVTTEMFDIAKTVRFLDEHIDTVAEDGDNEVHLEVLHKRPAIFTSMRDRKNLELELRLWSEKVLTSQDAELLDEVTTKRMIEISRDEDADPDFRLHCEGLISKVRSSVVSLQSLGHKVLTMAQRCIEKEMSVDDFRRRLELEMESVRSMLDEHRVDKVQKLISDKEVEVRHVKAREEKAARVHKKQLGLLEKENEAHIAAAEATKKLVDELQLQVSRLNEQLTHQKEEYARRQSIALHRLESLHADELAQSSLKARKESLAMTRGESFDVATSTADLVKRLDEECVATEADIDLFCAPLKDCFFRPAGAAGTVDSEPEELTEANWRHKMFGYEKGVDFWSRPQQAIQWNQFAIVNLLNASSRQYRKLRQKKMVVHLIFGLYRRVTRRRIANFLAKDKALNKRVTDLTHELEKSRSTSLFEKRVQSLKEDIARLQRREEELVREVDKEQRRTQQLEKTIARTESARLVGDVVSHDANIAATKSFDAAIELIQGFTKFALDFRQAVVQRRKVIPTLRFYSEPEARRYVFDKDGELMSSMDGALLDILALMSKVEGGQAYSVWSVVDSVVSQSEAELQSFRTFAATHEWEAPGSRTETPRLNRPTSKTPSHRVTPVAGGSRPVSAKPRSLSPVVAVPLVEADLDTIRSDPSTPRAAPPRATADSSVQCPSPVDLDSLPSIDDLKTQAAHKLSGSLRAYSPVDRALRHSQARSAIKAAGHRVKARVTARRHPKLSAMLSKDEETAREFEQQRILFAQIRAQNLLFLLHTVERKEREKDESPSKHFPLLPNNFQIIKAKRDYVLNPQHETPMEMLVPVVVNERAQVATTPGAVPASRLQEQMHHVAAVQEQCKHRVGPLSAQALNATADRLNTFTLAPTQFHASAAVKGPAVTVRERPKTTSGYRVRPTPTRPTFDPDPKPFHACMVPVDGAIDPYAPQRQPGATTPRARTGRPAAAYRRDNQFTIPKPPPPRTL